MKVAQFEDMNGPCVGIELDGKWIDYSKAESAYSLLERNTPVHPTATIAELLAAGRFDPEKMRNVLAFVRGTNLRKRLVISPEAELRAPVRRPPKIVALGLNYALHAKEGNYQVPKEPIIFVKSGSSVIGPGETVRIPRRMGRMDHEVELAVVIGKQATAVSRRNAWKYIAGYTVCNDVTARDLQMSDIEKRHPWYRSKSFDTFTPMGPWIITADAIPTPLRLTVTCRVNGRIRQRANTRDLVFDVPTIIEHVTRHITLEPGDIISTGTPEGIGPITHGDTVVCSVERIGELKNPVRFR
ncbi:MAG: fumarylacetoacetate hydrolase family protein [Ignavibacteria bacterium]|nr:fumarylacetoacetate hydrolase family protein [Ignavibacteria bacterium]